MRTFAFVLAAATMAALPAAAQDGVASRHRSIGEFHAPAELAAVAHALEERRLVTLPTWTGHFSIKGTPYSYSFVGSNPRSGMQTTIPTIIVPIRLTIPDYKVNGRPLVLDATKVDADVEGSPIFYPSFYVSGVRQFADAMLHAEFPNAAEGWTLTLSPSVAPTLDITVPKGDARVIKAKSGKLVVLIRDDSVIDQPIMQWTRDYDSPGSLVIFNTFNALEHNAFGYHSFVYSDQRAQALQFIYNSWLVGIGDAVGFPSPDAVTLSHEIAEVIHDPLGTSTTRRWGDAFRKNRCFQRYIEVGDAVEYAPPRLQFYDQWGDVDGKPRLYTLQTEALLPWFERQTPSHALGGAYSFPGNQALTRAAPLNCVK